MRRDVRDRLSRRVALVRITTFPLILLAAVVSAAWAQDAPATDPAADRSTGEVVALIDEAREALQVARDAAAPASPDAPVWADAIAAARTAVAAAEDRFDDGAAAPDDTLIEAQTVLARAYQGARWWVRAVDAWERRIALAGPLPDELRGAWRDAVVQLAYARYQAGDLDAAAARFAQVLEVLPSDPEALRWSGRIALERGEPTAAIPYWQALVDVAPGDEGARYYLELAGERAAHGRAASDAYREGLRLLEADDVDAAIAAFLRAEQADPNWIEPVRWRARALLDAGLPGAVAAWRRVVEARPEDEGAAWFLQRARLQAEVGRTAIVAADEARAARERGDAAAALTAWRRAIAVAPQWRDAQVGLARAATEAGDAEQAETAWRALLDRLPAGDPLRAEARQGLATAELLGELDASVAADYVEAETAFERGDVATATAALERVVAAAPETVEAWAFLGRIAFAQADWQTAARAYERAVELDPNDPDLAFFAREARALAGPDPDEAEER